MAKIKNISGEDRIVPALGDRLVLAGHPVDVPVDLVTGFTQQETSWAPADAEATELHEQMLAELAELLDPPADSDECEPGEEFDWRTLVNDVIPALDAEALSELHGSERARPRPRTSVLEAIDARAAVLAEAAAEDPAQDPPTPTADVVAGTDNTPED